mmetsp:Transcript_62810/g.182199  ORF Transcript_62810/g.182199 Transcript_62810/m.182199 type:complete len:285 (-) Transcript_62810:454-1308(-)
MGCATSTEITPEQEQHICKVMVKEMMLICVDPALNTPEQIRIPAPGQFDMLKNAAVKLRRSATEAAAPVSTAEGGGIVAAMKSGFSTMSGAAGQGAAAVLGKLADAFDAAVAKVEAPFSTIAADVVAEKKEDIADVLCTHIIVAEVPDAAILCRAKPGEVSDFLIGQAARSIATQVRPRIEQAIQAHAGLKAWNAVIESYNAACAKLPALNMGVTVDISDYICEQTVIAIGRRMAEEEIAIRSSSDPAAKAQTCPDVFRKVFRGEPLVYKDRKTVDRSVTRTIQ